MLLLAVLAHVGDTSHPCAGGPMHAGGVVAALRHRLTLWSRSGGAHDVSLLTFNVASCLRSRHAHVQRVGLSTLE